MELVEAFASRRSCRAFRSDPIPAAQLDAVLAAARHGPTAGNTWALDLVVLDEPDRVRTYWDVTLPVGPARDRFPWPGLLAAPVLVVVVTDPDAYVARYAAPDKARTGLGVGQGAWPVPYWWVDAGASVMSMLLAATDAGLGSLLFGTFDHEAALRDHLGVPDGRRLVGTVALGRPDTDTSRTSASATRRRPPPERIVHRGRW